MPKKILITGSGGLIGSEAVNFYCKNGDLVVGVDNDMRSYYFGEEGSTKGNVSKHVKVFKNYQHFSTDIRDQDKIENIFKQNKFDLIIHTAAQPSHDWAAKEPQTDFSVNANGTLLLLENYRKYSPEGVFIFTSTNKVYGDAPNNLPLIEKKTRWEIDPKHTYKNGIREDMPIDNSTHSLFGVSKTSADLMVQEYGRYFNLMTGVFRGGCLTGAKHAGTQQHGFLSYLVKCIITGRKYKIFGYKGKQVRDNIHSSDLINAFNHFFQNPKKGEVYNMGGSRFANVSIIEAVEKIEQISGKKAVLEYVEQNRIGDHIWYVSSVEKFKSHYPTWDYKYNIDSTIEDICRNSSFSKQVYAFAITRNLDYWKERNWYYHNQLKQVFKNIVPENSRVLQIGYGLGDILASLFPKTGISVDTDEDLMMTAKKRYPYLKFYLSDPAKFKSKEKFDYVIFPNSFEHFIDIQDVLGKVKNLLKDKSSIVIASVNPRWEQLYTLLEKLGLKRKEETRNWLRMEDLTSLIELSGYKVSSAGFKILLPLHIPVISRFVNEQLVKFKWLSRFGVQEYVVASKAKKAKLKSLSCSLIIPTLNNEEYINTFLDLVPKIAKKQEVVIVDRGSSDKTVRLINNRMKKDKHIKLVTVKSLISVDEAVKLGIENSFGDSILITEPDLSFNPKELQRLYVQLALGNADLVLGTRMVYPYPGQPTRQLSILANSFINFLFSAILGQRITDVLCGVKAFTRSAYKKMNFRNNFNNNPLELLVSAKENNLSLRELPVHYNPHQGVNHTSREVNNAFLLLKISLLAFWKLKILPFLGIKKNQTRMGRLKELPRVI